jgi:predicted amidophosphoribosyltransferase
VRGGEQLCGSCRRELRHLGPAATCLAGVAVWAPVGYEGPARDLVRALKFRGALGAAETMAALMTAGAPAGLFPRAGLFPGAGLLPRSGVATRAPPAAERALVPVPLHPVRRRRRGYNQAAVLADALARRTGLGVADCLARAGPQGTQVGRPRAARLATPPGRITVRAPPPARALLVDDVATTGATLAACAKALRTAGAVEVRALAFARTLGR